MNNGAFDRDISGRIGFALLNELLAAAQQGKNYYTQLGIGRDTFNDLSALSNTELLNVCRNPFLRLGIDERVLSLAIQATLANRNRDDLHNQAILHGASRSVMQRYARMPYNTFNRRRCELGIDVIRNRPTHLDDDEYHLLAELHNAYGQSHPVKTRVDHLRCLLHLSERSGIDVNRIYWYYYRDNENLFVVPEGAAKHA